MSLVLDSYAILVLFEQQPGCDIVTRELNEAVEAGSSLYLSAINYGKIYYTTLRRFGRSALDDILRRLEELPIEIVPIELSDIQAAAELKSRHRCSYADCFAAALGLKLEAVVMTGDPEFASFEQDGLKVTWLPPNRKA